MAVQEMVDQAASDSIRATQFLNDAEAARSSLSKVQAEAEVLLSEIQSKHRDISEVATLSAAAKAKIADGQAVIAEKSVHIEDAQRHADKVRAELDKILTDVKPRQTEIEALEKRSKDSSEQAATVVGELRATKVAAESDATAVKKLLEACATETDKVKGLSDRAEVIDEKLAGYEGELKTLNEKSQQQLDEIVGLLPGATSAGLASAFDKRRQTFLEPGKRWQRLFVGSLVALVVLAATGLYHVYQQGSAPTYDELVRLWLARLPIGGALVWLALYSSREAALAKRLEEDYGYKAAIASSFQGFQKQMQEIGKEVPADSPLGKLCADTLSTIASPPGRIYDKHKLSVSPTSELTDMAKEVAEAVKTSK